MAKIPIKSREDLASEDQHIYDKIARSRGKALNLFKALLNSPKAAENIGSLGAYLRYDSTLAPNIREITILTIARELNVAYEWAHHEPIAREVGVSDNSIERIHSGQAPNGMIAKDGVFTKAAKEIMADGSMETSTFQAVEHLVGIDGVVDFVVLVGYYTMLGGILRSFDIELDEGVDLRSDWLEFGQL